MRQAEIAYKATEVAREFDHMVANGAALMADARDAHMLAMRLHERAGDRVRAYWHRMAANRYGDHRPAPAFDYGGFALSRRTRGAPEDPTPERTPLSD